MANEWDNLELSEAYNELGGPEITHGAERVYKNFQDGEFNLPFEYLNKIMTMQLTQGGYLTDKEFIRIRSLIPDNKLQTVKVNAQIYRYLDQ